MLFALITTATYGGTLRAYMLRPEYSSPISTMEEIVTSGLTWNYVLYGDEFETLLASQTDKVSRTFWENKKIVPYDEYPVHRVR